MSKTDALSKDYWLTHCHDCSTKKPNNGFNRCAYCLKELMNDAK